MQSDKDFNYRINKNGKTENNKTLEIRLVCEKYSSLFIKQKANFQHFLDTVYF